MEGVRRATAESLNQTLRRMRQAPAETAVLQLIADATAAWADRMVVLSFENDQARSVAARNISGPEAGFSVESGGAIGSVIESKDPMVARASSGELSPELARALTSDNGQEPPKAYLFPVVV